ncbi:hypothetical protein MGN70_010861 [Eutypa lata]|uniref:Putative surface protein 1 protein n=1 Tax=Eutypa lata (strain UCR-EL1) TaxID=1287681 RepID=M7TAB5_EUTLA|nr:putative surface protein 1 protein [Eutypa lata UCREL1]KAI1246976.1 hypothetical protein MGN70_010861 [Eutypa lata]
MQFSSAFITAILSATALATPVPAAESKSMMAAAPEWTIAGLKRTCNAADDSCAWTFSVNTHLAAATPCSFTVKGKGASKTNISGQKCGPYTVGTGYDGKTFPGNGFTVLSVVDYTKKLIVWPGYTDVELVNGKVVSPDKSYAPATVA